MKHKVIVIILVFQLIVVCCGIGFLRNRISSGTEILLKMTATTDDLLYYRKELSLTLYNQQGIAMSDGVREAIDNTEDREDAYIVISPTKNSEGYNDVLYVTLEKPVDTPLYIPCSISDGDIYDDYREKGVVALRISNCVVHSLPEKDWEYLHDVLPNPDYFEGLAMDYTEIEIPVSIVVNNGLLFTEYISIDGYTLYSSLLIH